MPTARMVRSIAIDGQLAVNNDGVHGLSESNGVVALMTGPHAFQALYFQGAGWGNARGRLVGTRVGSNV